jgi:hypothetical protein
MTPTRRRCTRRPRREPSRDERESNSRASAKGPDEGVRMTEREALSHVAQAISVRLDDDSERGRGRRGRRGRWRHPGSRAPTPTALRRSSRPGGSRAQTEAGGSWRVTVARSRSWSSAPASTARRLTMLWPATSRDTVPDVRAGPTFTWAR